MGFLNTARYLMGKTLSKRQVGGRGEDIAEKFLKKNGLKILHRNYRAGRVEFDIIAREDNSLVFVEVKTSRTDEYGDPAGWITTGKRKHMIRAARMLMQKREYSGYPVRFDVVTVKLNNDDVEIEHFRDAFSTEDLYPG